MTTHLFFLLAAGACMVAFAMWAMWSRKKVSPGPENNWQQRDGSELYSGNSTVDREETALIIIDHGGII
jgi:hypothetical protein